MSMSTNDREFDIILYGATGYTGRLALEYLARTKRDLKTFAVAGRNLAKLKEVAQAAGLPAEGTNFVVADASSAESLRAMAARARVVVAMVGPFVLYGMPLIHACIAARTHYVDITGEFNFVADVAQFNDQAREAGIYLVCSAGFDCVPSDLVNFQVYRRAAALAANGGATVKCVQALFNVHGGVSNGTLTTLAGLAEHARPSDLKPLSLLTAAQQSALGHDAVTPYCGFPRIALPALQPAGTYVAPFFMSDMNEKIARKTSALLGFRATYVEGIYGSFMFALLHFFVASALPTLLTLPVLKSILAFCFFPPAREGPSAAERAQGKATVVGRGFDADPMKDKNAKELVRVTMHVPMDGYTFTAMSAIETAQALADGELTAEAKESGRFWSGGGAVTPAAVVGDSLTRRLEKNSAVKFE